MSSHKRVGFGVCVGNNGCFNALFVCAGEWIVYLGSNSPRIKNIHWSTLNLGTPDAAEEKQNMVYARAAILNLTPRSVASRWRVCQIARVHTTRKKHQKPQVPRSPYRVDDCDIPESSHARLQCRRNPRRCFCTPTSMTQIVRCFLPPPQTRTSGKPNTKAKSPLFAFAQRRMKLI